jgi:hypothetical protein
MVFDPLIKPWKREENGIPSTQPSQPAAISAPMPSTPIETNADPLIKPWKSTTIPTNGAPTETPDALKLDSIQEVEYSGPKTSQKNFFSFINDLKTGIETKDLKKIGSTLTNYGEYKGTFNDLILHPYLAGFHGGSAAWNMGKGVGSIAHVLLENAKPQADDYIDVNGKQVFDPGKGAERNSELMKNALLGIGKDFYQHWIEPTMSTDIQLQTMINPLVSRHTTPEQKEQIGYWAEKSRQNLNDYRTYEWDAFFSDVVMFGMAGVNLASKTPLWADMEKAAYKAGLTGKYAPGSDLSELGLSDDLMKAKGQEEVNAILASKRAKSVATATPDGAAWQIIHEDLLKNPVKKANLTQQIDALVAKTPIKELNIIQDATNKGTSFSQSLRDILAKNYPEQAKILFPANAPVSAMGEHVFGNALTPVKVSKEVGGVIKSINLDVAAGQGPIPSKIFNKIKIGTEKVSELFPEIKMLETGVEPYFHRQYKLFDKSIDWKPDSNDLAIVKQGLAKQGLSPLEADGIIEQTLNGKMLPIFDKGKIKAISYSGGSLKHRENIPEYIRTHLLGEVTQPAAKVYETLRVQKNNQTWGQLYYKWSQNPNLVFSPKDIPLPSTVKAIKGPAGIDLPLTQAIKELNLKPIESVLDKEVAQYSNKISKLETELNVLNKTVSTAKVGFARMQKIRSEIDILKKAKESAHIKYNPLEVMDTYVDPKGNKYTVNDIPETRKELPPPGFLKMPKDPQFGALSDKYVRQQLLDELIPAKDSANNIVAQAFKAADQWIYQPVKTGLTVGSPGGQARNVYADAYFLWVAGTEPQDVLRAIKSIIKKDRLYLQATKNKVIHTDFARNETLMKWLADNEPKGGSLFEILGAIAKAPVQGLKLAWSFPDDVTKLATFNQKLRKGETYSNAAKFTRDMTPYYDDPSKFAQLMKGTISPFFMFTNEAIRTQLIGGAIHQPVRAVVAVQMPNLAREFAKQKLEIQDETYNKLVRAIPSYIRDQQWIPVSREGNKVMIMSIGSALPLSNVSGLIPQTGDSVGKNISRVVNNPLLGAFTQLTTGAAPGQEGYTTSLEKILPEEKTKRILGKSAMSVLPGLSRLNGRLVTAQGENALQKPWMVAVDYGVGAKFYVIDLDLFDKTTTQSMRGTVSDTKSAMKSIMKKQREGTLTPEEKDDFMRRLKEGARKKLEDLKKQREGRSALPGNLVAMGEMPKAAKNQAYEENLQRKMFPDEWNKQYGSKS